MHIDVLQPRQVLRCPSGKNYYDCADYPYQGCCSRNPCKDTYACVWDDGIFIGPQTTSTDDTSKTSLQPRRETTPRPIFSTIETDDEDTTSTIEMTSSSDEEKSTTTTTPTEETTSETPTETATDVSTETETGTAEESSTDGESMTSRIMTDSGATRTIPNPNRVTVTRHTLIVTDKAPDPTPTPSVTSSSTTSSPTTPSSGSDIDYPPVESSSADGFGNNNNGTPPPTGIIVGAAVGGAIALAIIAIFVFVLMRRKRGQKGQDFDAGTINDGTNGLDDGEKNIYQGMSPHTTGTRASSDPFAPFGGRADKLQDAYQPPAGTFEMDGTSTAPVELPAVSTDVPKMNPQPQAHSHDVNVDGYGHDIRSVGPSGLHANLNASSDERLQKRYVNHWNQYRTLGQGQR